MRTILRALVAALVVMSCVRCTSGAGPPPDEIIFAGSSEWQTLNPLYMSGSDAVRLGALIYTQLFTHSNDGSLVPQAALAIPTIANGGISDGGRVITYHLRRGMLWSDGAPLTATDIIFTHAADMNPQNSVADRNADDMIAAMTAPDPYTVRVRLIRPYSPFVFEFDRPILPAHLLAKYASLDRVDYNGHPVGSGPFRVLDWQRGSDITLVRNDAYWGPKARVSKLKVRFIASPQTIVTELESGDIDGANFTDPSYAKLLEHKTALRTVTAGNSIAVMLFNTAQAMLADQRVRRAIVLAINRVRLIKDATEGLGDTSEPGRGLFGWAYDPAVQPLPYDPALARRLLDAAGWKLGPDGVRTRGGKRLQIQLVTQADHEDLAIEVNEAAQELKAVGIASIERLYIDQVYYAFPNGVLSGGKFDVTFSHFGVGDPPFGVESYLGCTDGKPTTYNFTRMCLAGAAPAMQDALASYDPARERRDYAVVQRALAEQVPLLVLARAKYFYVINKRLHGFEASPFGEFETAGSWWVR